MARPQFVCAFAYCRTSSYFWFSAIANKAAVNIGRQALLWTKAVTPFGSMRGRATAGSRDRHVLHHLGNCQSVFQSACATNLSHKYPMEGQKPASLFLPLPGFTAAELENGIGYPQKIKNRTAM